MNGVTSTIDAAPIDIRMFGALQVRRSDGTVVDPMQWRTAKTADLLRLLAVRDGSPVPVDTLLTTFWPGADRQRGQGSLRTAASQIRHVLGAGSIARSPAGLAVCGATSDVTRFRTAVARTRAMRAGVPATTVLQSASHCLELYIGDFDAHDRFAEWVMAERYALAEDHLWLLGTAAEAALECDEAAAARRWARTLVALDGFNEHACRLLMRACAAEGETSAALRAFEGHRRLLSEELGIDPSPQTCELYLGVLRSEVPALGSAPDHRQFPRTVLASDRLSALVAV